MHFGFTRSSNTNIHELKVGTERTTAIEDARTTMTVTTKRRANHRKWNVRRDRKWKGRAFGMAKTMLQLELLRKRGERGTNSPSELLLYDCSTTEFTLFSILSIYPYAKKFCCCCLRKPSLPLGHVGNPIMIFFLQFEGKRKD